MYTGSEDGTGAWERAGAAARSLGARCRRGTGFDGHVHARAGVHAQLKLSFWLPAIAPAVGGRGHCLHAPDAQAVHSCRSSCPRPHSRLPGGAQSKSGTCGRPAASGSTKAARRSTRWCCIPTRGNSYQVPAFSFSFSIQVLYICSTTGAWQTPLLLPPLLQPPPPLPLPPPRLPALLPCCCGCRLCCRRCCCCCRRCCCHRRCQCRCWCCCRRRCCCCVSRAGILRQTQRVVLCIQMPPTRGAPSGGDMRVWVHCTPFILAPCILC